MSDWRFFASALKREARPLKQLTCSLEKTVIDLIVVLKIKDQQNLPLLRELLAQQILMSRQEPGCVRMEAHESQAEAGTFFLVEQWASQEALDVHRKAHACTTLYFPKVVPLVERVPHPSKQLPGT